MTFTPAVIALSVISGIFASLLIALTLFFEKDKRRSKRLLVWGALLLGASFGLAEYAIWLEGGYLFSLILSFNFPLISYFTIWCAFFIWVFESRGERKTWIILLAALTTLSMLAVFCPDCISFRQ